MSFVRHGNVSVGQEQPRNRMERPKAGVSKNPPEDDVVTQDEQQEKKEEGHVPQS
jgi:hypothetical protein